MRPSGFGADIADVPNIVLGLVGQLTGLRERHELDRDSQAIGDRVRHAGGDAFRVAIRGPAGNEQKV